MASDVQTCNMALAHIGAETLIQSIDPPDGTVEANYCATFYAPSRRELLEDQQWSFSKKRVQLAEVTNDSTIWQYAYAVPSDMINALRILQLQYLDAIGTYTPLGSYLSDYSDWRVLDELFTERGSDEFELETTQAGVTILRTNQPNAVLLYTADITDVNRFSSLFISAHAMMLASYLAPAIIKGTVGMQIGAQWREAALKMSDRAASSNANSANERADHVARHLMIRS